MTKTGIPELILALSAMLVGVAGKGAASDGAGKIGVCAEVAVSLAELDGLWAQLYKGKAIALKKITVKENMAAIDYVVLDEAFCGGKYSAMKVLPNDSVVFYEDYGDKISRHVWRRIDADTFYCVQSAPCLGGLVHNYIMQRICEP